jgi:Family of unknown function (DUF5670)
MLLIIAIVLGILWLTGKLVINIATPFLHLLLVIAAIIIIYNFLTKGRSS